MTALPLPAPNRRALLVALLSAAAIGAAGCGRAPKAARPVPPGAVVLALGDSLTHGTGASPAESYPAVLATLTGWQLVNAGVPGDTSAQGLARLPALLDEHRPALVLLGLGGNDLLRRQPEDALRANLREACERSRAAGAQVLLIAVPRPALAAAFTGSLADHPLYAELAAELALPLLSDGWASVLADDALRSDRIHANAQGYARFAARLRDAAQAAGLLAAAR